MTSKFTWYCGAIITFCAALFGKYWFLFVGFLVLNVIDYITGVIKAKFFLKNTSSVVGATGIVKKVLYWVVIGISFYVAFAFVELGKLLNIDLSFVTMFGWFTLASYLVNEIRSILENLIEMNVNVPRFLSYGMEVAENLIRNKNDE